MRDLVLPIHDLSFHVRLAGQGPVLLLLHGFTGSADAWVEQQQHFAREYMVVVPDLIGHGSSDAPPDPGRYGMAACVADLLALLDALACERVTVLGYSMGGRVALQLAAAAPGRVERLILESASPGLASAAERQARCQADHALADSIEREGLVAFVDYWQALPLFASQTTLPAEVQGRQRAQRLQGRPLGLANSLRGMGTGQQESLWERLPEIACPTLLLAGALDQKFVAIVQQMAERMPDARVTIVAGAGHTIHLEQPEVFATIVRMALPDGRQA